MRTFQTYFITPSGSKEGVPLGLAAKVLLLESKEQYSSHIFTPSALLVFLGKPGHAV